MAKISRLPAAAALTGAEQVPLLQNGRMARAGYAALAAPLIDEAIYAAAEAAGTIFPDVASGLAATGEGACFRVVGSSNFSYTDLYRKVGGAAVFVRAVASLKALPLFPELFGAGGNGIDIDTAALTAMIAAGGPHARFTGLPGSVYRYDGELYPQLGQHFSGMRFARAPQAVTTLTAPMNDLATNAGATLVLQVASAAAFRVGSCITITRAVPVPGGGANTDIARHRIVAKTANTLTVFGGFTLPFAAGDEVVGAYHLFANTADEVVWQDILIDGNRAAYQNRGLRWETMTEIRTTGDRCRIDGLGMVDIPGEGVQLGGQGSTLTRWWASNVGGNAVHLSGGDDLVVSHFNIDGANRVWFETDEAIRGYASGQPNTPGTMGHEDGGIAWSLECRNAKVFAGTVRNALSVISPPTSPTADLATVRDVAGFDCKTPFRLFGFGLLGRNVTLANCRFTRCGRGIIGSTDLAAGEASSQIRTVLRDCHFEDSFVTINRAFFVDILGGSFVTSDAAIPAGDGVITVSNSARVRIDTLVDGAEYGVLVTDASQYVDVSGTRIRRFRLAGLHMSNVDAGMKGNRMHGGEIEATDGYATAATVGVVVNGGDEASGIEFDFLAAPAGARCIQAQDGSRHFRNLCRVAPGVFAVHAFGGSAGIVVKDNFAVVASGTWELGNAFANAGGEANMFADNYGLVA